MEIINCRTCCEKKLKNQSVNVNDRCYLTQTTIKGAVLQLIPELTDAISNDDYMCKICLKSLIACFKFIERCKKAQLSFPKKKSIVDEETHDESKGDIKASQSVPPDKILEEGRASDMESGLVCSTTKASAETLEIGIEIKKEPSETSSSRPQQSDVPTTNLITCDHNYCKICLDFDGPVGLLQGSIIKRERALSLRQPGGIVIPEFLSALQENSIKIIQHSAVDNNTPKRILLLGKADDTNKDKVCCRRCRRWFTQARLKYHSKYCVTKSCIHCDKPIGKGLMKRHIAEVHKLKEPFKCQKCGKVLKSLHRYKKHVLVCEVGDCPHCDVKVARRELRKHCLDAHGDKNPYKCPKCPKMFPNHTLYKLHIATHQGFPCDVCKRVFKLEGSLQNHKEKFKGGKCDGAKKCVTCSLEFATTKALYIHKERNHRDAVCEVCGKRFHSIFSLRAHQPTHNSHYAQICHRCGKGFKTHGTLRQHLLTHYTSRRLTCDRCPRTFNFRHKLLSHIKTVHDMVRDIPCQDCSMMFGSRTKMLLHYRTVHLRVKPFKCDKCEKAFARREHLKLHGKSHERELYRLSIKSTVSTKRKRNKKSALKSGNKPALDVSARDIPKFSVL